MKIIEEKKNKLVKYFGMEITVPWFTTHLATDKDGKLNAFEGKPEPSINGLFWWVDPNCEQFQEVATIDLEGMEWTTTLQAV